MESDEELVIITLLLDEEDEEESRGNKRKHRMWIHDIFKKRSQFGEYLTLFTDSYDVIRTSRKSCPFDQFRRHYRRTDTCDPSAAGQWTHMYIILY
ncbi:unnamed protein product [Macrosiphum euphorbiae]|uniref:Uncharacterized protein n=1 Tax=Macrosiphum euphorbiae TaxID=13131 RepID=A0AAV0XHI5_9HEMI|nr:unnamed protein product [Macrosiphum euphorbiae]